MKVHTHSILFKLPMLRNYAAITLGRHVFLAGERDEEILAHEAVHIKQIERLGLMRFYIMYLGYYIRGLVEYGNHDAAYMSIPFEVEAYANTYSKEKE